MRTRPGHLSGGHGSTLRELRLRMLENQHSTPGAYAQTQPRQDPQSQSAASLLSLGETGRLLLGMISDSTAIGNAYRVQLDGLKQPVVAFYNSRLSTGTFGARDLATLRPGTMVVCVWYDELPFAGIIGVVPGVGTASNQNLHAILSQATRARVDEAHKAPFRMENNGNIPAFLAGRPYDATHGGEAGYISETGLRVFVDSFMAQIGGEECNQLTFYHHDMLARLATYQFQMWTACREHESMNDQEETLDWTGYAMYPWEQLGMGAKGNPAVVKSASEWQVDEPYYGTMEPKDNYMMPWHREREFHGYLGQGGKRIVVAPAEELASSDAFASYADGGGVPDARHPGLFDSFVTADGRWCVQAAKGISLVKRAAIMAPTRRRRPEDAQGDTEENYKASGQEGSGEDHEITGDIEVPEDQHSGFTRAAGIRDMHAYFFNYAGLHPFFYHAEDYKVYQESDASWSEGKSAEVPDYGKLASESYIDAEDYKKTWNIDHRYGEQSFYTLSCGFELLDDGTVLITDGYGGSIRMTGGSVEISAPGDVWMKGGRNCNVWAGQDAIIRAKNSWDITSSEGDGRLKAEKNLMALGGNQGIGGILLESRGAGEYKFDEPGEKTELAGVCIRSQYAPFVSWSSEIYLRTGGGDLSNGPIVLDAGKGEGMITMYAQQSQNYVKNGTYWHFNTNDETVDGPSASITDNTTSLPGTVFCGGSIIAEGSGMFDGSVLSTSGYSGVVYPFVAPLEGDALTAVQDALEEAKNYREELIPQQIGQQTMDSVLKPRFYESQRPGSDEVIENVSFSLRIQEDYRTEEFKLYEDVWQQLGRITGKASATWQERPVTFKGQDTYPYPGKEAFDSDDNFIQQDLELFDASAGHSKDRGEQPSLSDEYKEPKFGAANPVSLNQYTVIR